MPITFEAVLLLCSPRAGAPLLIKPTAASRHDLTPGASTMMLLVLEMMGMRAVRRRRGLATAQRDTAASMLIASGSFTDPDVFVLITLVNTLGLVLLIVIAKGLKRDNAEIVLL